MGVAWSHAHRDTGRWRERERARERKRGREGGREAPHTHHTHSPAVVCVARWLAGRRPPRGPAHSAQWTASSFERGARWLVVRAAAQPRPHPQTELRFGADWRTMLLPYASAKRKGGGAAASLPWYCSWTAGVADATAAMAARAAGEENMAIGRGLSVTGSLWLEAVSCIDSLILMLSFKRGVGP